MSEGGRNARFVRTAKTMLLFQVGAGAMATAVGAWALFEVADLARERDALAARVAQLEAVVPPELLPPAPDEDARDVAPSPPDEAEPPVEREGAPNQTAAPNPPPGPPRDMPPPPATVACELRDGTATRCPVPLERIDDRFCYDVERRAAYCPGRTTVPDPVPDPVPTPPAPPADERNCQSVDRRPIVCVPPFTRTPVPGVCADGRGRPVRCPPGTPTRDPPREQDGQQQQPATKR